MILCLPFLSNCTFSYMNTVKKWGVGFLAQCMETLLGSPVRNEKSSERQLLNTPSSADTKGLRGMSDHSEDEFW